jgi:hypothetical protein
MKPRTSFWLGVLAGAAATALAGGLLFARWAVGLFPH